MNYDEIADDSTIRDKYQMLSRIPVKKINIIWNHNIQCWRPSSASFENHPNGTAMSVVLLDDLENAGRNVTEMINEPDEFALAAITAGSARMNNQKVIRDPLPEEPAHGLVVGDKTKSCRRIVRVRRQPPSDDSSLKSTVAMVHECFAPLPEVLHGMPK